MDDFEVISYIGGDNVEEEVGDVSFMQETYHSHYELLKNYDIIKKNNITRAKLTKYERTKCASEIAIKAASVKAIIK